MIIMLLSWLVPSYYIKANPSPVYEPSLSEVFDENMIETIAIRTMSKAEYSTDNIGHYGLAFQYYTHFTSPIRRYPDLIVHRAIKGILHILG